MQNLDCSSLENSSVDFDQVSTMIVEIRNRLSAFGGNLVKIRVYSFEIPHQLITPLENLNVLFLALAQEAKLTDAQKKILTTCERTLARFYCWIHDCLSLYIEHCKVEPPIDTDQQARQMAYEFYFYAMYELRSYYSILKGYLQAPLLESESGNRQGFLSQVSIRLLFQVISRLLKGSSIG